MISHCQLDAHRIMRLPRCEWAAAIDAHADCTHADCTIKDCKKVLRDYLRSLAIKQNNRRVK